MKTRQPNGMLQPTIIVQKLSDTGRGVKTHFIPYKTYRLLRKDLPNQLRQSFYGKLSVSRSRHGMGFEWFEKWEYRRSKPTLIEEGWM